MWIHVFWTVSSLVFHVNVAFLASLLRIKCCPRLACQNSASQMFEATDEIQQLGTPAAADTHKATINCLVDAINMNMASEVQSNEVDIKENAADAACQFIMDPSVHQRLFSTAEETDIERDIRMLLTEKITHSVKYESASTVSNLLVDDISESMLQQMRTDAQIQMRKIIGGDVPKIKSQFMQAEKEIRELQSSAANDSLLQSPSERDAQTISHLDITASGDDTDDTAASFTELVKASMQERMQLVSTGNVQAADPLTTAFNSNAVLLGNDSVRGIVGDSLFSMAEALGVDVSEKLAQSDAVQNSLQRLLSADATVLSANLASLEAQSQQLYQKLADSASLLGKEQSASDAITGVSRLQGDVMDVAEAAAALHGEAATQQSELRRAALRVADSQRRMQDVLHNMRDNADLITSLALFQLQPADKKVAFVLGLALFLKVRFDLALYTVSTGGDTGMLPLDHAQWGLLALQAIVCVACLQYYGLWKAVAISAAGWGRGGGTSKDQK